MYGNTSLDTSGANFNKFSDRCTSSICLIFSLESDREEVEKIRNQAKK
jgi:hypothetical protein